MFMRWIDIDLNQMRIQTITALETPFMTHNMIFQSLHFDPFKCSKGKGYKTKKGKTERLDYVIFGATTASTPNKWTISVFA